MGGVRHDLASTAHRDDAARVYHGHHPGSARTVQRNGPRQLVIDSTIGEVFVLATHSVVAPLSSDDAFARYARLNGSTRKVPPAFVTARLGYLTLPVGPGFPDAAHHQLAWGYSYHQHCISRSMNLNDRSTPHAVRPCIMWDFLDATDGTQIDSTQQH
jgi:hypothetical protein